VVFGEKDLNLNCKKTSVEGPVDIIRPLRFLETLIVELKEAFKYNTMLRKSFATVFCESLARPQTSVTDKMKASLLDWDPDALREMYMRIALSDGEDLAIGLFKRTKEEEAKKKADEDAERAINEDKAKQAATQQK
jgi:hypothetical protein